MVAVTTIQTSPTRQTGAINEGYRALPSILVDCPLCTASSRVIDSRPHTHGAVYRRRECDRCRHRWTTYEVLERAYKRMQRVEAVVAELLERD